MKTILPILLLVLTFHVAEAAQTNIVTTPIGLARIAKQTQTEGTFLSRGLGKIKTGESKFTVQWQSGSLTNATYSTVLGRNAMGKVTKIERAKDRCTFYLAAPVDQDWAFEALAFKAN